MQYTANEHSSTLRVMLGERSYPIHIGASQRDGLLAALAALKAQKRQVFVVTNPAIREAQAALFDELCQEGVRAYETSCDGEPAKEVGELSHLWETFAREHLDRTSVIVAVGGGVIGDLAGFAAATYLRGVDFIQVPTTLLAMVDSSVGGKTGINLSAGKNLAGAFHQPIAVYADTDLLATLPGREFAAGMAEVIKTALLGDVALLDKLERAGRLHWRHAELPAIIRRCCEIKATIVRDDECETQCEGGRALLNLGHTFGHAIEQVAGYGSYLHGEGVAIGTVLAARLSQALGLLADGDVARIEQLLRANDLPTSLREPLPLNALLRTMSHDKKVLHGKLRFVTLHALGKAATQNVDAPQLIERIWLDGGASR
ncbi:MAG: 3-dehydroquinate synthase [Puniceicoccales bacterium]|jgi:3-dehydroquinate synthase|nr:3-dehydroquinate synthase [Puniceicoccales bacterium]